MFNRTTKRGKIRKRKIVEDDDEDVHEENVSKETEKLKLAKLKRELLKKSAGVSAAELARGKRVTKRDELTNDPFKIKSGGGITYAKDRNRDRTSEKDERNLTNISDTFKVEKKIRDEEEEMNKYIERELLKRRGIEATGDGANNFEVKKLADILDPKRLYELPQKYIAKSQVYREDGLLSAQMLNGIPEVDLGINTKLTNIERTEIAKRVMVDKFIKDELKSSMDTSEKNRLESDVKIVRGGQEFTDQFYSQHMRFYKGDEPDSDAVNRVRTHIGEWKTADKVSTYGEEKELGGIHGDDVPKGAALEGKADLYKRFADSQGSNKFLDTTGHRI